VRKFWNKYIVDTELNKNLYVWLVWRFILVMILFSICRVAFYLVNKGYFPNTTFSGMLHLMRGGLMFDTSALLYTNLLFFFVFLLPFSFRYNLIFQKVMKGIYLFTNGVAILANCADFIYFQFAFRRTTASIFSEFKHEDNLGALMPKFISGYWYVVLIWIALLVILFFAYGPYHLRKPGIHKTIRERLPKFGVETVIFAVTCTLIIGGLRGGFMHCTRPITLSNAGTYISEPLEANIVLNTPFAIYRTLGKQALEPVNYFTSEEELNKEFNPIHTPIRDTTIQKQNVVILILESFGSEYTKTYAHHLENGKYTGYTPFLDSLMDHSKVFMHSYSNGRKSIDAMPSVLTSLPMLVEPFLLTSYSANALNSVASLLNGEGYYTAYFHGAPNGSMGFEAFAHAIGFQDYFGMSEFPDQSKFDGSWGVWDEEFFQFFAQKMNGFREPFCTALFSVSSHHPFVVPERYEGKFDKGTMPIHQCIGYSDYSLRKFFESASKMPWYKNTLFVITADHTSQVTHLEYKTNLGAFRVPMVFYRPDGSLTGHVDSLAQQTDILPSIMGYLNYNRPFVSFGRNLFDPAQEAFVINYTSSTYQLVMDKYLYLFDGMKETGFYDVSTDTLLSDNIAGKHPEIEARMEKKMKAIVQQYTNRMILNKLTIDK